jgi:hypothetical protein
MGMDTDIPLVHDSMKLVICQRFYPARRGARVPRGPYLLPSTRHTDSRCLFPKLIRRDGWHVGCTMPQSSALRVAACRGG